MSKKTPTKKAPTKPQPQERRLPQMPEHQTNERARHEAGFVPDQWNSAIRFTCAVRDAVNRPIGMIEAFDFMREMVREHGILNETDIADFQRAFDERVAAVEKARLDEQKRIAAEAGKR